MCHAIFTENVTGVPEFWLTIFKNVDMLSDMIQEHDEPILKHLQDIKVKFSQSNPMVSVTSVYIKLFFAKTCLVILLFHVMLLRGSLILYKIDDGEVGHLRSMFKLTICACPVIIMTFET